MLVAGVAPANGCVSGCAASIVCWSGVDTPSSTAVTAARAHILLFTAPQPSRSMVGQGSPYRVAGRTSKIRNHPFWKPPISTRFNWCKDSCGMKYDLINSQLTSQCFALTRGVTC